VVKLLEENIGNYDLYQFFAPWAPKGGIHVPMMKRLTPFTYYCNLLKKIGQMKID